MAPRTSTRRYYRKQVRSSTCRGKGPYACVTMSNCKVASRKGKKYCRKRANTHRRKRM